MNTAVLTLLVITSVRYGLGSPVIEPDGNELVVNSGEIVHLKCTGNYTVKWKGLTRLQKKHVREHANSTDVYFEKATYTDTGTYICVYNNTSYGGNASVHLFVKDASNVWNTRSVRVTVNEDTDVIIPCLITDPSIPVSQVSLKTPHSIEHRPNISFKAQEGFTIHNVQTDYEGHYVCQATVNGTQKSSGEILLRVNRVVKFPPAVTLESGGYVRVMGEEFQIICNATGPAVLTTINWEHSAENVAFEEKLMTKESVYTLMSTLSIHGVKITDGGNFTCIGKNERGSSRISTFLQVEEKGYVHLSTFKNNSFYLRPGENVELKVEIDAYPSNLSWNWTHENLEKTLNTSCPGTLRPNGSNRYESTLTLHRLKESESGKYTFFAANSEANSLTFNIFLYNLPTASISVFPFNNTRKVKCRALGFPTPTITWFQCPGQSCSENGRQVIPGGRTKVLGVVDPFLRSEVESVLRLTEKPDNITIGCMASNIVGNATEVTVLSNSLLTVMQLVEHKLFNEVLAASIGIVVVLFLLLIGLYYKYQKKLKFEPRWQIVQVSDGNHYTCIDPTQLPYNEKWEFPRTNLHFGKILGAGAFGKVIEATAFGMGKDDSALKVAVKMLKPRAHKDEMEALMSELKILSHLGNHQNIVNLLGACTHGGPILVITEYCRYGDLLNFLRKKAEAMNDLFTSSDYKNMAMDQKYIRSDSGFSSQCMDNYIEMRPVSSNSLIQGNSPSEEQDTEDCLSLDLCDLLNFSIQVAQGMSFLETKSCLHRDVAARNVLVTQGRIAKICDFGLARDIENDSNYVVKGNARLPVKWMAPESIFECVYTAQSDVWSYGILLWEIFSLGRSPYPGILVNRKFYKLVKEGYKMDCPDFAPLEIYRIMKACWDLEPTLRPTFSEIGCLIDKQMSLIKEQSLFLFI
ncbi:hypothetical protein FKM82_011870 [Ascaphus truei]